MAIQPKNPRDRATRAPIGMGGGGDFSGMGMSGGSGFGMGTTGRGLGGAHEPHDPKKDKKKDKKDDDNKNLTLGKTAKLVFMPEFGRSLDGLKFAWDILINLVAQIYVMVKLIPANHPCADHRNAGKYGLKGVIKVAFNELKWHRDDIPRIAMFVAVLAFLFFVAMSIITVLMNLGINVAKADDANAASNILDQIFNLQGSGMIPTALGAMLKAYSSIVLILAGLILVWTIVTTVVESMREGKPFGKSFNGTWAPMRLVFALGLLIPLSSGLNSGQYITLYLAKWGSDLASGVFRTFSGAIDGGAGITMNDVSIETQKPLARLFDLYLNAYIANDAEPGSVNIPTAAKDVFDKNGNPTGYKEMLFDAGPNSRSVGTQSGTGKIVFYSDPSATDPAKILLNKQWEFFSQQAPNIRVLARAIASRQNPNDHTNYFKEINQGAFKNALQNLAQDYNKELGIEYKRTVNETNTWLAQKMQDDFQGLGWVSAPIHYQQIAKLNADIQSAYQNVPEVLTNGSNMSDQLLGLGLNSGSGAQTPGVNGNWTDFIYNKINEVFTGRSSVFGGFANSGAKLYKMFVVDSSNPLGSIIALGNLVLGAAQAAIAAWTGLSVLLGLSATEASALGFGGKIEVGMALIEALTPLVTGFIGLLFVNGYMLAILFPLIPVIRFVFAVLGWVAMVLIGVMGMPLFALAHLKTGGEGWVGQLQVASAYNMLIGIIIRPTLIILGYILGIMLFNVIIKIGGHILVAALDANAGATVSVFGHDVAAGTSTSSPFNFTSQILTLFLFSSFAVAMANACFKLVDIVPSQAMTWMGTGPMSSPTEDGMGEITSSTQSFAGQFSQFHQSKLQHDAKRGWEAASNARQEKSMIKQQTGDGTPPDADSGGSGSGSMDVEQGSRPNEIEQGKHLPATDTGGGVEGGGEGGGTGGKGGGGGENASVSKQAAQLPPDTDKGGGGKPAQLTDQSSQAKPATATATTAAVTGAAGAATAGKTDGGEPGKSDQPKAAARTQPKQDTTAQQQAAPSDDKKADSDQADAKGEEDDKPKGLWGKVKDKAHAVVTNKTPSKFLKLVTMAAATTFFGSAAAGVSISMANDRARENIRKMGAKPDGDGKDGPGGGAGMKSNHQDPQDPNRKYDPTHPNRNDP